MSHDFQDTRRQDRRDPYTEPIYRSREHAVIARMLDRYGIPFFYRQATLLYDRGQPQVERVDFSLPTYNLALDYQDSPNSQAYHDRERLFAYNQIPLLLLTRSDLEDPCWDQSLYERLEEICRCPLNSRNLRDP